MTKGHFVQLLRIKVGFPKNQCTEIVDLVFELMKESLERGENVKIYGFGSFVVRQKKAHRGRNPRTGEDVTVATRKAVTFKSSGVLRREMNSGVWLP